MSEQYQAWSAALAAIVAKVAAARVVDVEAELEEAASPDPTNPGYEYVIYEATIEAVSIDIDIDGWDDDAIVSLPVEAENDAVVTADYNDSAHTKLHPEVWVRRFEEGGREYLRFVIERATRRES